MKYQEAIIRNPLIEWKTPSVDFDFRIPVYRVGYMHGLAVVVIAKGAHDNARKGWNCTLIGIEDYWPIYQEFKDVLNAMKGALPHIAWAYISSARHEIGPIFDSYFNPN